jgi:hypothetical protein
LAVPEQEEGEAVLQETSPDEELEFPAQPMMEIGIAAGEQVAGPTAQVATQVWGVEDASFVMAHETKWYADEQATLIDINGSVQSKFGINTPIGNLLGPDSDIDGKYSRLQYFLLMFPPNQLSAMCQQTNVQLAQQNKHCMSTGELLRFFGILILATKFEFSSRSQLWSTTAPSKYIPAPAFGKTGMSRQRFDDLWRNIRWSNQCPERPEGMSSHTFRWQLVDDFVERYNNHRANTFKPSHLICVDESMSRWYGQGGEWINHGLPNYVAIDRKPENGCEIQNAACGCSGIMLRLKVVKGKTATEDDGDYNEQLLHGTKILKELVLPWWWTDRIVCADLYFSSVGTAMELQQHGLRFIGVVKTATKQYPMRYLSTLELNQRGERRGLVMRDVDTNYSTLLAFVWMDRDRRYFVSSASSLDAGKPYVRYRWRQIDQSPDADPERLEIIIPQPKAAELYYSACGMIDRHNRSRQDTLMLERKLGTTNWSTRVNLSIFGMIVVDTWLAYSLCTGIGRANGREEKQKDFYTALAEELVDNQYDNVGSRRVFVEANLDSDSPALSRSTGEPRSGLYAHLTPTKKRRKNKDGSFSSNRLQGRCLVCSKKTTYVCSVCKDEETPHSREPWVCYTTKGKLCYANHMATCHGA